MLANESHRRLFNRDAVQVDQRQAGLDERQAKRYVVSFVGSLSIMLISIAALNYWVDPSGYFGTGAFEPAIQLTRKFKADGIEGLESDVSGLILGSSRVLKIEPEVVQQFDDQRFFNAGVNYGKPEDFLALVKHYQQVHGRLPASLVIGVDVAAFSDHLPVDTELLENDHLAQHVRGKFDAHTTNAIGKLLSMQQTRNSLRSLKHHLLGEESSDSKYFRPDGVIIYKQREEAIQNAQYDFQSAFDFNAREYSDIYKAYDSLSEKRWHIFKELIELATAHHCKAKVFITPDHPQLAQALLANRNYVNRSNELNARLEQLAAEYGFDYFNLQSIASFGGDEQTSWMRYIRSKRIREEWSARSTAKAKERL